MKKIIAARKSKTQRLKSRKGCKFSCSVCYFSNVFLIFSFFLCSNFILFYFFKLVMNFPNEILQPQVEHCGVSKRHFDYWTNKKSSREVWNIATAFARLCSKDHNALANKKNGIWLFFSLFQDSFLFYLYFFNRLTI